MLALQIAPAARRADRRRGARVTLDGRPVEAVTEVATGRRRTHVVESAAGELAVAYRATVEPGDAGRRPATPGGTPRPSATCCRAATARPTPSPASPGPSWRGTARPDGRPPGCIERLIYTLGLSTPLTTAVETLGAGAGACRDFAHLTVTLLRAIGIPARLVGRVRTGPDPHGLPRRRRGEGRRPVAGPRQHPPRAPVQRWSASPPAGTPPTPRSPPRSPATPSC